MTPFPDPENGADAPRPPGLEHVATWAAAVLLRVSGEEPEVLPGIVSPLDMRVDFAVNVQTDAASVTLGNGMVRLSRSGAVPTSGSLLLSLRWSPGYGAAGVAPGDRLADDWLVEAVEATRLDLSHAALTQSDREVAVPVVTIVRPSAAQPGDEFTARLTGSAPECRDATLRGWVRA